MSESPNAEGALCGHAGNYRTQHRGGPTRPESHGRLPHLDWLTQDERQTPGLAMGGAFRHPWSRPQSWRRSSLWQLAARHWQGWHSAVCGFPEKPCQGTQRACEAQQHTTRASFASGPRCYRSPPCESHSSAQWPGRKTASSASEAACRRSAALERVIPRYIERPAAAWLSFFCIRFSDHKCQRMPGLVR